MGRQARARHHRGIEKGEVGKTNEEILAEVDKRWRDEEFPSKAVSEAHRKLVETRMFKNWWFEYGEEASLATEGSSRSSSTARRSSA